MTVSATSSFGLTPDVLGLLEQVRRAVNDGRLSDAEKLMIKATKRINLNKQLMVLLEQALAAVLDDKLFESEELVKEITHLFHPSKLREAGW